MTHGNPWTSKDFVIFSFLTPVTKSSTTANDSASFKRKVSDKSDALSNGFVVVVVVDVMMVVVAIVVVVAVAVVLLVVVVVVVVLDVFVT